MADTHPRPGQDRNRPGERSPDSMLDVEFSHVSDPGKQRDHNEDYLGHVKPATAMQARSQGWLFALADGVGGHDHGEVASKAAGEELVSGFQSAPGGETLSPLT